MSLTDLKNRFAPAKKENRADPAHAFGSEEQVMAAFAQQTYTQPQPKERGSMLAGLRQRLNRPRQSRQNSAPVYTSQTYSQPSAPDLGWEAAFDPRQAPPAAGSAENAPAMTAEERFRAFRDTVYASPAQPSFSGTAYRPAPVYEEIGGGSPAAYTAPGYAKPVYEEITLRQNVARETSLPKPVYEEIHLRGESPAAPETAFPEEPVDAPPSQGMEFDPAEPFYDEPQSAERAPRPGDMQYFFWSGSIIAGPLLTLFAFIYACAA